MINFKGMLSYKDVIYRVEGLESPKKIGDQLGFEPSTFCILGSCSYYGATGTPWQWSRGQVTCMFILIDTLLANNVHSTCLHGYG